VVERCAKHQFVGGGVELVGLDDRVRGADHGDGVGDVCYRSSIVPEGDLKREVEGLRGRGQVDVVPVERGIYPAVGERIDQFCGRGQQRTGGGIVQGEGVLQRQVDQLVAIDLDVQRFAGLEGARYFIVRGPPNIIEGGPQGAAALPAAGIWGVCAVHKIAFIFVERPYVGGVL